MSVEKFRESVEAWVLSLPQDVKTAVRVVEDPNLDDESRVSVAGGLLSLLSGSNAIPGVRGILALVGDVIVLRIILEKVWKKHPEDTEVYCEQTPGLIGEAATKRLSEVRAYLGDHFEVLTKAADSSIKINHQGHVAKECVHDTDSSTWLYDAINEATVDQLDLDEEEVARELKNGVGKILPALSQRKR